MVNNKPSNIQRLASGFISIVGAGPGDPDLLTVKALNRLKVADAVLYDALLGDEILKLTKPEAKLIYVGKLFKDGQDQTERQNQINQGLKRLAEQGQQVVRLKAGDPMIFGRGAEEITFCLNENLSYEVVPGITAGLAASSINSIPLTIRGKNCMCLFYTGHLKDGGFDNLDTLVSVLRTGAPVVLYMGLANLEALSSELMKNRISGKLSVQILSKVSQPDEKAYQTKLSDVKSFLKEYKPAMPAVIIIGKYVSLVRERK